MTTGRRRPSTAILALVALTLGLSASLPTADAQVPVSTVHINEVESSGGTPGDWVELVNTGPSQIDIAGWKLKDNDDSHAFSVLPAGSTIAAGGYLIVEEAALGFGLGAADSVRLYDSAGSLYESYSWSAHAATTYGRCPNGTGAFTTTASPTKGAANACAGGSSFLPWPGGPDVATVDGRNVFGGNLSGLDYEGSGGTAPGVLWGVRNGPGALFRLVFNGSIWTPDPANGWGAGKALHYPDGTGNPDAEGVTFTGADSSGGLYVSTERNNDANSVSRLSVLRFDPSAAGSSLTATREWNLTADLPAVGANLGLEAITWIPDTFLVARGFLDESKGHPYVPAEYPGHGTGLFFVGLEANGTVYAYALDHLGGGFTRVATISSGFPAVMDLQFDGDEGDLWAVCDDTCAGRTAVLRIDAATGKFVVAKAFERPAGMPNLNNEGFAIATAAECVSGRKPVFWADDSETNGHAIRQGTLPCTKYGPSIATTASAGNLLGAPVFDTARVTGGVSPTGTVTFRLFGDARCSMQVFTSTNPLGGGTATSDTFTPVATGGYFWTASYSGDANNNPAASPCGAPGESVVITPFVAPAFTRTVTGDFIGSLTVDAGDSVHLSGARIAGTVTVNAGGALTVDDTQVSRGIVADRPAFLGVCGSQVSGPSTVPGQGIVVSNAAVPVRIGDPAAGCTSNRVAGDVLLTANTAGLTLGSNVVSGNVTVSSNMGGTHTVKANTVFATLSCAGNNPGPINAGQPNTAKAKSGQCAAL